MENKSALSKLAYQQVNNNVNGFYRSMHLIGFSNLKTEKNTQV